MWATHRTSLFSKGGCVFVCLWYPRSFLQGSVYIPVAQTKLYCKPGRYFNFSPRARNYLMQLSNYISVMRRRQGKSSSVVRASLILRQELRTPGLLSGDVPRAGFPLPWAWGGPWMSRLMGGQMCWLLYHCLLLLNHRNWCMLTLLAQLVM